MTILAPYKGFQASVEYDGGVLLIRLLHIEDAVSTSCGSASEVEDDFHELVDDYIETCKGLGKKPNRPFKGSFNIRIKPETHREAAMAAETSRLSLNAWVEAAICEKLGHKVSDSFLTREFDSVVENERKPLETWEPASKNNIAILQEFRELAKRKQG